MNTDVISPLRQRMIEDMNARKLCAGTQRGHIRSCKRLAAFLKRSPETATLEDIRGFQLHLSETGVNICSRNRIMTGLRFLFRVTLRRLDLAAEIYHIREPQKIPLVMSPDETKRLLATASSLKARILLSLGYGSGLRAGEVIRLKVKHIDSAQKIIRIEQSKGRKDRNVMLSAETLDLLRQWWKMRPSRYDAGTPLEERWLFPGNRLGKPMTTRQLNRLFHEAADAAGIRKGVTLHALRHSFATPAVATSHADGSPRRLFLLTYGVGTVVTIFLSNDATAVVLTPAVAAAVKAAKAKEPLPYLLICAFIANAASFVLPISNPANLVIYGSRMPPLLQWLPAYLLPSLLAIVATYVLLRFTQRGALRQGIAKELPLPALTAAGKMAAVGIAATAVVLLAASALDLQLGLPTAIAGSLTAITVLIRERKWPWSMVKDISWGVLPLVAGLFVLVEALVKTGLIDAIAALLRDGEQHAALLTAGLSGVVIALASNLLNNLPAGLMAASAVQTAQASEHVTRAILIGVDLGPNLSVTGSLATILWLSALRREGRGLQG